MIQDQLGRVGFRVRIQSYDWGTFYGDIKNGRFQVYSLAWVGVHTPDIFRYVFHSQSLPPQGANRGRFHDPQTDELITQAESAQDYQVQADLYRRLQQRPKTNGTDRGAGRRPQQLPARQFMFAWFAE